MESMKILSAEERKALREKVEAELLSTSEVEEVLGFSRYRLAQLVREGRIQQIKHGIYLKADIYAYKHDYAEARKNGKWLTDWE